MARLNRSERQCDLAVHGHFPKLAIVGSNPGLPLHPFHALDSGPNLEFSQTTAVSSKIEAAPISPMTATKLRALRLPTY